MDEKKAKTPPGGDAIDSSRRAATANHKMPWQRPVLPRLGDIFDDTEAATGVNADGSTES